MASPTIVTGDVLAVQIVGKLFEQETNTTFHWQVNSAPVDTSLTSMLTDIALIVLPDYKDCCSELWEAVAIRGRRVTPSPTRSYAVVQTGNGTVGEESLPPSVAGVISRFTNSNQRTGRGRIFLPAVPETWHQNGGLNLAGQAAYAAFAPILDLPITLAGGSVLDPVLFRRPNTAVRVEGTQVRTVLRSQRRREIGVGI